MHDQTITGNNKELISDFKKKMMLAFEMTDLEFLNYFLGIEVHQSSEEIFICQKKYAEVLQKKFMLEKCKSVTTPLQANDKFCKDDGQEKVD